MKLKIFVAVVRFLPDRAKDLSAPCISFDASLVIYINSTNIPPIMIINRIYETQNLLSLLLVSLLVGLRTLQQTGTVFYYFFFQ
jgi:hypothetical protein